MNLDKLQGLINELSTHIPKGQLPDSITVDTGEDLIEVVKYFARKESEDEVKAKYNSVIEFCCSVDHDQKDGSDITGAMIRKSLSKRINLIDDQEMLESVGIEDTIEN